MPACVACGATTGPEGKFCASCGAPVGSDDMATLDYGPASPPASPRKTSKPTSQSASSSQYAISEGRFLPGRLVAGRYRIIAMLGKGGMGEVYRADDLTLGQPVALKFLPQEAGENENLLERFRNEVRIARRVSHPNVCRVYDLGEVEGHIFFSMEYVDGEDLASLLRRIGRLPDDKALQISRQICAGLAAAHAKGVLHRDLKPANIMLDGRGQAIVTDFGLAGVAEEIHGAEIRSGTPAYMAPEQLAGKGVDAKSDIYSLGLVLYEIFTGRRAFDADSLAASVRARSERQISRPSSHVKDLDPAVERVILRCLEADPAARPASALSVAAALPGGDPLAAALAAGETPSPEMVAAAGETEGMKPRLALLCVAACVLGTIAAVGLIIWTCALGKLPLEMSTEVLQHRAKDIVAQLGYDPKPLDSDSDFRYDYDFQRWADEHDQPHAQWGKILAQQPSLLSFTYRQSPRHMIPIEFQRANTPGIVSFSDPPTTLSGMINLKLDANGRLVFFQALPPELDQTPASTKPVDWNSVFTAAGLDPTQLQTATPEWTSLASSDTRAAWTGTWPGGGRPLRVEAAAWRGKPVFFMMGGPWTRPTRMRPEEQTPGQKAAQVLEITLFLLVLTGAAALARRQHKQGKGDHQGAFRLARVVFLVQIGIWICYCHFVPDTDLLGIFILAISTALFAAGLVWVLYMALEPFVRRLWPQAIISWTRLISGKLRDPLVGRDVMFGVILGLTWVLIIEADILFGITHFFSVPQMPSTDYLLGIRQTVGSLLVQVPGAIQGTLMFFTILLVLRFLLRNKWAAAAGFVAIFGLLKVLGSHHPVADVVTVVLVYGIAAFALVRFGLITLAVAVFSANLLLAVPVSVDFSRWYASATLLAPIAVLGLGAWGFFTALGGQKLIKGEMLE